MTLPIAPIIIIEKISTEGPIPLGILQMWDGGDPPLGWRKHPNSTEIMRKMYEEFAKNPERYNTPEKCQ